LPKLVFKLEIHSFLAVVNPNRELLRRRPISEDVARILGGFQDLHPAHYRKCRQLVKINRWHFGVCSIAIQIQGGRTISRLVGSSIAQPGIQIKRDIIIDNINGIVSWQVHLQIIRIVHSILLFMKISEKTEATTTLRLDEFKNAPLCPHYGAFLKRFSNRKNFETPSLRFGVDGKYFKNGAVRE